MGTLMLLVLKWIFMKVSMCIFITREVLYIEFLWMDISLDLISPLVLGVWLYPKVVPRVYFIIY